MLDVVIKKLEVDTKNVLKATANKKKRVLYKQGGYVQKTMQRSLRISKKKSEPGLPPRVRSSKSPLRKGIKFHVDLENETVVVGPDLWAGSKVRSSKPLPQLLNEGGSVKAELKSGKSITAEVKARPFLAPVFSDGGKNFNKLIESEKLKD